MRAVKHALVAFALATAVAVVPTAGNATVGHRRVLDLELDDAAGATAALDSSGSQHEGAIGSHLAMNGSYADWDRHAPDEGIAYHDDHLIAVSDDSDGSLDPGTSTFIVTMRFRTKGYIGNVIQKGQAHTTGGQVKVQGHKHRLSCMFRTSDGMATATSGSIAVNDNHWHLMRCVRTSSSVTVFIDGVKTNRIDHHTGNLDNTMPWTIGGKADCDAVKVTCDYFSGEIDFVRMTKG